MRMSASERLEETNRAPLEAASDPMVMVDAGEKIIRPNVRLQEPFGYCQDELVGQKITKIIPEGFAERLTSDALQAADVPLARQIGTGSSLSALRKSGTIATRRRVIISAGPSSARAFESLLKQHEAISPPSAVQ